MKLPKFEDLKKFPGNKVFGKKEKGLGKFHIACVDCGKPINIDDTSCPRSVKKLLKRNLKMRGIAMLTLEKLRARCPECEAKAKAKGGKDLTKDEAFKTATERNDEGVD